MPLPAKFERMSNEELLELNIADLGLSIKRSPLLRYVHQLYEELDAKGITFHPPCHVGDEWFCPEGIPAIFIPFFLMHPRLRRLERRQILEVEGETPKAFMQLLRHEAGHALSYAYRLQRKRKWQQHFGLASTEQTNGYRPQPNSRSFVIHLPDWYAQSHPDEDWAETFAVWLTPKSNWRERYKGWKALKKLRYTDELMASIAGKEPVHQPRFRVRDYHFLNLKLKTYYARKRKEFAPYIPDIYDKDLARIFSAGENRRAERAGAYLRRRRRVIVNTVARWTGVHKFRINELVKTLTDRCDALELRVNSKAPNLELKVATFFTSLTMNYRFTGRFKRNY